MILSVEQSGTLFSMIREPNNFYYHKRTMEALERKGLVSRSGTKLTYTITKTGLEMVVKLCHKHNYIFPIPVSATATIKTTHASKCHKRI